MIARISGPGHKISQYEISDRELPAGSTLGAPRGTLLIKATGALEKLYSAQAGIDMFGTLVLHYWDGRTGIPLVPMPGDFIINPSHQEHIFELSNRVTVREDIFMLNSMPRGDDRRDVDPPAAYYTVELQNDATEAVEISTYASIHLNGGFTSVAGTVYDAANNAFVVRNEDEPDVVRIAACSVSPESYEVTVDGSKPSAATFPGKLSNTVLDSCDQPIGIFHLSHRLRPNARAKFYFVLTFSLEGEKDARAAFGSLPPAEDALEKTAEHYEIILNRAVVVTPDPEVNRGVLWAKANMLRSQSLTQQGWCFVNDPTRSNNSVGRDTAWYANGCDYVMPGFSKEILRWYIDHIEPNGMVVEYFDIRNGKTDDYGLNINDDTPLIIMALWHHFCITGDREFLEEVFPKAQRAANYILSQRNGEGLVWCTADKTSDWGIVGWRNIIDGYRLSGATTELNSECYAALRMVSYMAEELGDRDKRQHYADCADDLRTAINEHLLDKSRNLYYLNIDVDGTKRADVTCDLVFPVMFGVAEHEVAANIIARLSIPEFWTDAGLHTVPRNDINYQPTTGHGLLGGVWSGPTFWFAFAAAAFNPEFMAYALSVSFKHYSQDPRRNNTVPGQFSEWLHGETLTNQGMMLSPWFAPKYLWAAIEGAAGLTSGSKPDLKPRPSNAWSWIGVHNLQLRGNDVSWFAVRTPDLRVYTNYPFDSVEADQLYHEDITDSVHVSGDSAVRLALRRNDRAVVLIGNTLDRTITTAVTVKDRHLHGMSLVRAYNTLRREWIEIPEFDGAALKEGFPIQINSGGFAVLEFHGEQL
ncbi:MAG TPA: amylo-alpha-1,6-glucosidase [Candidatus Baltobacteraceae bacterium]|nr:amylo-alpha-1,6-glucosidase [Candidatus Baltobacteraceae bacterium]